jgi:hypothetical protein
MVIFGAGASYDSVPARPPNLLYNRQRLFSRPPLAAELFLPEGFFAESLRNFPRCHPIVPYLQGIPSDGNIEGTLEKLQNEGAFDPERKRQLAAIRCYLQFVICECEREWNSVAGGITNYVSLLDQLRRTGQSALLVTFNYDRLIENAFASIGHPITELPHYVDHPSLKLFKVHGSVNWAREVEIGIAADMQTTWEVMNELIDKADGLKVTNRFKMVNEHPIGLVNGTPMVPAIAIPVETKTGFECPDDHLAYLRQNIRSITKILVVGWRGTENHFLELLRHDGLGEVPIQVVDSNRKTAEEVLQRITAAGLQIIGRPADDEGFTPYIVSRKAEQFLAE